MSSREGNRTSRTRKTRTRGCCPCSVLERILVRPRQAAKDHRGTEESRVVLLGIRCGLVALPLPPQSSLAAVGPAFQEGSSDAVHVFSERLLGGSGRRSSRRP